MERVQGHCPMGCGETLFLGDGGHVTCSLIDCPRPTGVDELLMDRESEHIAVFEDNHFSLQHPMRERLDGDLFSCELHDELSSLSGPPVRDGRYRVRWSADVKRWLFEEVPS